MGPFLSYEENEVLGIRSQVCIGSKCGFDDDDGFSACSSLGRLTPSKTDPTFANYREILKWQCQSPIASKLEVCLELAEVKNLPEQPA